MSGVGIDCITPTEVMKRWVNVHEVGDKDPEPDLEHSRRRPLKHITYVRRFTLVLEVSSVVPLYSPLATLSSARDAEIPRRSERTNDVSHPFFRKFSLAERGFTSSGPSSSWLIWTRRTMPRNNTHSRICVTTRYMTFQLLKIFPRGFGRMPLVVGFRIFA